MRNKSDDLKRLANAFLDSLIIDIEGCIGLDVKRPFGNSDVAGDVLEIIEAESEEENEAYDGLIYSDEQRKYAYDLFEKDLLPFIQEKWKKINA